MLYLRLNDGEWRGIEAACGWMLSKTLRENIIRVTQEFLTLENVQTDNVADVKVVLESYDKAASRFFSTIFADPSAQSAASIHAHDLIESTSKGSGKNEESLFDAMLTTLRAFHIASLKQLRELQTSTSKSDKAWRLWICWLTEAIDQEGLPSSVSKDLGSKGKINDQFTGFVWQLQRCLPEDVRRHTASEAECAEAIADVQAGGTRIDGFDLSDRLRSRS
jgi:hypothetical protein